MIAGQTCENCAAFSAMTKGSLALVLLAILLMKIAGPALFIFML